MELEENESDAKKP